METSRAEPAVDVSAPETARKQAVASVLRRFQPLALITGLVIAALALQTQLYTGQVRMVTTIFTYVGLAAAWNLIGGFAGYACFGQVGFFGLGAYATAVLMTHAQLSFWLCVPIAAALGGLLAAVLGFPLLRLKGHYFAVATLGVAEGLREIVLNLPELTGGGAGISIPSMGDGAVTPWLGNDGFYVLFLLLAALIVALSAWVSVSRTGYALRAIHQDEDAAAAVGIDTTRVKTSTFAASAALTAVLGAAYAFQQITIFPERLFDVHITVLMVVMVVLGGAGTVAGPVIGAVFVAYVSEWLRDLLPESHAFALGALVVVAVILLPQGFTTYLSDARRTGRYSLLDNLRRYRL